MKLITLGQVHQDFEESLQGILRRSKRNSPLTLEAAQGELGDFLSSWDGRGDFLCGVVAFLPDTLSTRLLLSVSADSAITRWCKEQVPHAEWGCCVSNAVAVEYAPDSHCLVTQLHEALHLFGVDDCYDAASLDPRNTCSLATCLMRYGVQSKEVCNDVYAQLCAIDG
jgi:hypothetical protein